MAIQPIQPTFSGGEFAPSLRSRVDIQKYSTGLALAENFLIHPQGGISNRPGFKFIARAKYSSKKCRLVPFEYSITQAYIIEFGEYYARFYANSGQIVALPGSVNDFDPTASYTVGNVVKVGMYRRIGLGISPSKHLTFMSPYGQVSPVVTITIITNSTDDLDVSYSSPALTIKLANSTKSKNRANLIQAAIRAVHADFTNWTVTQDANYLADSDLEVGVSVTAEAMYPGQFMTRCIQAFSGTAANTSQDPDYNPPDAYGINLYWVNGAAYEIITPYAESDLADLKFTQSADTLYIVHPNFAPRTLTRFSHTNWVLNNWQFTNGPFQASNTVAAQSLAMASTYKGASALLTSNFDIFENTHIGSYWQLVHEIPSKTQSGSLSANGSSSTILGMGGWRLITHGTWTGKLTVEKSIDNGSNWIEVRVFTSSNDFNANAFGTDDNDGEPALYRVTMSSYSSGTANYDLTIDQGQAFGVVQITGVGGLRSATATVIKALGSTATTTDWAEGSWSAKRGYPSCITFFQDRIALGATATEPQGIWLSKTGNYLDFGTSDPLVDDDSIALQLPSRQMNGVKNLIPLGELLSLTASSEWSIGSGSGDPITPTTAASKVQGYRGSNGVDPVIIGNRIVYVQPMGTIVRDIGFEFSSDGYTGDDVSLISNHLFRDHEIKALAYQQEPDSIVWAVREDGEMPTMTYLREQQVLAWTHQTTDGLFESVATIPGVGYNQVWVATKRGNYRFIELMAERMASSDPEDQLFLDCSISYDGAPATVIGNLGHLEGLTVSILADGKPVPDQVVTDGQITLSVAASVVHIGLAYECNVQTLRPEPENAPTSGKKQRCASVMVKFLQSRGGQIGYDEDHLYDLHLETKNPVGQEDDLFTGDYVQPIGGGWEDGGTIYYRQNKPLPVTILGFIPTLVVGG